MRTTLVAHEKIDEVEVSQKTEIKIVKNDFGSRKKTTIEILLGKGIILSEQDIKLGIEAGIIKKEGKLKHTFGKISWNSKRTFYDLYSNEPKQMEILRKKIHSAVHKLIIENRE